MDWQSVLDLESSRSGRTPSLRTIRACRGRLGGGFCLARLPGHVGFGSKQASKQSRNGEIGIECFPMQTKTPSDYLNLRQLLRRCLFQSLSELGRERKAASIGQLNDHPAEFPVVSRRHCPRLIQPRGLATGQGSVDPRIRQFNHGFPPTEPTATLAVQEQYASRGGGDGLWRIFGSRKQSCCRSVDHIRSRNDFLGEPYHADWLFIEHRSFRFFSRFLVGGLVVFPRIIDRRFAGFRGRVDQSSKSNL